MPQIDKLVSPDNRFVHDVKKWSSPVNITTEEIIIRDLNIRGQIVHINTHPYCANNILFAEWIEIILNNNLKARGMRYPLLDGTAKFSYFITIKGYDTLHIRAYNVSANKTLELAFTGTNDLIPSILSIPVKR